MQLQIRSLQHIGIPVTDIKRSEAFYESLGFKNNMRAHFPYGINEKGTCVMMQLGNITLELYEMPEPDNSEVRNRKNGHIDHIAFDVADIDLAYQTLLAAGCKPIEPLPVKLDFWKNGCKYFNILGPDGERLEFNQIL
jgi:catechol 2,3-dioxygenase-like lactoylglutathione lyase family enzyme